MAGSAFVPKLATEDCSDAPRHAVVVRVTHWINAVSFLGLLVSGMAILISHPRLYWGETGNWGTPSFIDLPLPFVLANQNGWGRYLHFLAAWVCVFTGLLYVVWGGFTQHFRRHLLPARSDFTWASFSLAIRSHARLARPGAEALSSYNVLQRLTYLAVIFGLFPLAIWTGLAMSPAITSVFPAVVTVFGGQQSARTIHFFVFVGLVLFLLVHIAMVCLAGVRVRMREMITGYTAARKERAHE